MSEIRIKTGPVKNASNNIKEQSREIRRLVNAVRACDKALAGMSVYGDFHKNLNNLMNRMLEAAAHESTMSAALMHVTNLYENAEKAIVAEGKNKAAKIDQMVSAGLLTAGVGGVKGPKWLVDFINWITGRGAEITEPKTPEERERAADLEMKQKAADLRNKKRYSERTWREASVSERRKILEEYMHDVEKILGVEVSGKIYWTYTGPTKDGINFGEFYPSSNTVAINSYVLENYSGAQSYRLMLTVVHELRHAYQYQAIQHPENFQVTQETIDSWKESFRTYNQEQAKGHEYYRNILVERDARWFAGQD